MSSTTPPTREERQAERKRRDALSRPDHDAITIDKDEWGYDLKFVTKTTSGTDTKLIRLTKADFNALTYAIVKASKEGR